MLLLSHCLCWSGDKEPNEESEQQQQCLLVYKGLEGSVKFNPALQKEMKKKERGIKKINDYQRQGVWAISTCV